MRDRGLVFRLSVLIVSGGVLVLALLFGYNYQVVRTIILHYIKENALQLAQTTVARVDVVLSSVEKAPQNLAQVIEISNPAEADLLPLIRAMVESNHEVYGMTVAFEPYAFDPHSEYFAPYVFKRQGSIQSQRLGGATYNYFLMDWYKIPKETGRAQWSEPYFDEGGGGIIMSTYSVPLFRQIDGERRFVGVVTADVSLTWLQAIVSAIHISQSGYAFLISRTGVLVTHPTQNLVMHETIFGIAEARGDPDLREIGRAMTHGETGFVPTTALVTGHPCWLAYAPVPENGWSLGVLFPQDELMAAVTRLNRVVVGASILGAVFLLVIVVAVARSITRPLVVLAGATEDIARGNLDATLPVVRTRDEVGRLTASFVRMQRDLKQYITDLQETAAARQRQAEQLEEYSRTLEQKVAERTHDLSEKNVELERTLTQLEHTQEQLVVQEKLAALGALTAGIAHEIKNPLNFVNNFADLSAELTAELRELIDAQRAQLDPQQARSIDALLNDLHQNATKISEHGRRADSIVRGMLQHSRGAPAEPQSTDLNALLAESVNLAYHGMRAQDPSFNIRLETVYAPAVGMVRVVAQDLSRVFLNIMNNACYAAHARKKTAGAGFAPTVSVQTRSLGEYIEIRIRDNGSGMSPAVREKLFTPFFTTKPPGQGTGLGLSISYDIVVRQHQRAIRVETEEGSYAEFIIALPRGAN
jgi:signal transduction histidine kinase